MFCCSVAQLCPTLWDPMDCSMSGPLPLTISLSLPKFMPIASVMLSSHYIFWHPLLLLPSIFLSIRDFSNELVVCTRWPKYWISSFSISPSDKYLGLISLKIYWFDLFASQGTFQGSSPAPQFEGIESLVLCLLYGPALHNYKWPLGRPQPWLHRPLLAE